MIWIWIALLLAAGSGLPSLLAPRRARWPQIIGCGLMCLAALAGLSGVVLVFLFGSAQSVICPSPIVGGYFSMKLDPLAAFFLVPVFLIGALGSIYDIGYWPPARHTRSGPWLRLFYGILVAAMGLIVTASDGITFLFGWELMGLSAFGAMTVEHQRQKVRQAGWLFLVAGHISMMMLIAMFLLFHQAAGSFALNPLSAAVMHPRLSTAIFVLALIGFGIKAGVMPFHFWLPGAHANAPSHISAILSGVLLKMGIYGLIRIVLLLPDPPVSWGVLILVLGALSAVFGVAFALGQHEIKRLLAYHSIENIGIILMALGLAILGIAAKQPDWFILGMAACLLHVWNHALFKPLLFYSAGGVISKTHSGLIDRLGGLGKTMPFTAGAFLLGAVAICGLPPLNGFISEWLLYMGLFRTAGPGQPAFYAAAALAAPALGFAGTLAVACFIKAYGAMFLGLPRKASDESRSVPGSADPAESMLIPMGILAIACLAIGLFPAAALIVVGRAISSITPGDASAALGQYVSVSALGVLTLILALGMLAGWLAGQWCKNRIVPRQVGTWDCGYARPSGRMQYTATSLADGLVTLLSWILHPHKSAQRLHGEFPKPSRFSSHVDDVVLDRVLAPLWVFVKRKLFVLRTFQQGSLQMYLLYILLTLLILLLALSPWGELPQWLVRH